MSIYTDAIDHHAAHIKLQNVREEMESVSRMEGIPTADRDALIRITKVVLCFSRALHACDQNLIAIRWLDDASKALENISSALSRYRADLSCGQLAAACFDQLDVLLQSSVNLKCMSTLQTSAKPVPAHEPPAPQTSGSAPKEVRSTDNAMDAAACSLRLLIGSGKTYTTAKSKVTLGRKESVCDIAFPVIPRISRIHASIFFRDGIWYLVDEASTGGTWLNEERIDPYKAHPLSPGDLIDLAHQKSIFFLEGHQPPEDTPASPATPVRPQQASNDLDRPPPEKPQREPSVNSKPSLFSIITAPFSWLSRSSSCQNPSAPSIDSPSPELMDSASCVNSGPRPSQPGIAAEPEAIPEAMDDIQFRAAAPEQLNPGEYFPVKVMMFREEDYQRADREGALVADKTKSASSSIFQASKNQQFRIALQSPDVPLDCEPQMLCWNGKFASAYFEVLLPMDYARSQLRLHGRVYSGDAVLTDLKLILQVSAALEQSVACEKVRLRSAFISYASADRAKVAARIQGIQLARPDMDLFFDVESLRRGENWEPRLYREIARRDLFYLFWSQNAAASEWVEKELQCAIDQKSLDFIEPIPLESPDICAPPKSLMGKHFNDWTLRYLNNS